MDTRGITPNEGEGIELSTHGKKKMIVTVVGATVVGAAIGAAIIGGKPQPKQAPQPVAPEPDIAEEKDKEETEAKEVAAVDETKPSEEKGKKDEEPTPTDVTEDEKKDGEVDKPIEKEDGKDVANNVDQAEIDKITDELTKGSQIDEHDLTDLGGILDESVAVSVSLPNGLETTGYYFSEFGEDLVLLDLDGDGVFSDVKFVDADGSLKNFTKELHLNDGNVITFEEWVASSHITTSDIEQVLNDDGSNDLAMTDDDRRRMENDNAEEDIVTIDDPNDNAGEMDVLTKEEEDALLEQLLTENGGEAKDEDTITDEELEAILIETKPSEDNVSASTDKQLNDDDIDIIEDDISADIHSELG